MIAVEEVPHDETDKYGIVDATPVDERSALIRHMVEKPKPADAPSNLAVVGRYVLPGTHLRSCWSRPRRVPAARSS